VKVNGVTAGSNAPSYAYTPANGDIVTCILNSSNAVCTSNNPATSNAITTVVNPNQPVNVTVSPSANPVCSGTTVNFTALPVNGGSNPSWLWKVNGLVVGSNAPAYSYVPVNGDAVTCTLTSNVQCPSGNPAQSNPVTMVVNATLPAGITISVSANPFCPGSAVTFTATPVNGGLSPVYQWKVNGTNAGTNASTFTYNPQNNDSVRCILTSNLNCVTGSPFSSAKIIMSGTLAPVVTFTSCFDTITTIGAKPYKLKGGIPLGGTYSGPGVNGMTGIFTPSVAGTGLKTITYTYTNVASCSAGKSKTILVQPNPVFTCGNSFSDIRDGKSYPTVQIGTQCWMAANLDFGTQISDLTPQTDNCIAEQYSTPGDTPPSHFRFRISDFRFPNSYVMSDTTSNAKSEMRNLKSEIRGGALYQWDELMRYDPTPGSQGLCPPNWHVPTEAEWTTLSNFYNGNGQAGRPLQNTVTLGFDARLSGVFYLNSSWSFADFAVLFWTSTPWDASRAVSHGMNNYNFSVSLYPALRGNEFAVRCLKDQ